ncbi:MAG: TIGR01777 family oxidoreductase [Bacilli bacterium]
MANVLVAGGTGFIGRHVIRRLLDRGDTVVVASRDPARALELFGPRVTAVDLTRTDSAVRLRLDAVVNLAGESLSSGRWTPDRKRALLESRQNTTRAAVDLLRRLDPRPEVLVSASAIGFYGASEAAEFTERSEPERRDFLADVTAKWEREAHLAGEFGTRVVCARFGVVLGADGGALGRMALPYRLYLGGPVGSGRQWVSWIHVEDAARLVLWSLDRASVAGPVNVTAPEPVTMGEFGRTLAQILRAPYWLPVPAFVLRTLLGEMANLVLAGQRVVPAEALAGGFTFRYGTLPEALSDLLGTR